MEEKNEFLSAFFIFLNIFFYPVHLRASRQNPQKKKKNTVAFDTVMLCQKNVVVFLKLSVRGGKTHIAAAAVEPNDKGANGRTMIYRVF